jgi:putative tryptophan/tyrosine transport system substrate-binding protein
MRRRAFLGVLGGVAAWPLTGRAQQPDRVRVVGALFDLRDNSSVAQSYIAAFRDELAKLGWKEGSNLRIESRFNAGHTDELRTLAKQLVDLRPDAILGRGTAETIALARETQTIPIVFAAVSDPLGNGLAVSFARPGGNITGFTNIESSMGGKWVELLKEIAPRTERIALLFNPTTAAPIQFYLPSIQAAAQSLNIKVSHAPVHAKDEIEGIIAALARDPGSGLMAMPDVFIGTNLELIVSLATSYRIPAVSYQPPFAKLGGLVSYGVDFTSLFRQAAGYIDRILKGAKPSDLPVQLPTSLVLVINQKTARALGLTIPLPLLGRADEVIE